jgi:hypothetical protein
MFGGVDVDSGFIYKYIQNPNINYKEFNLDVINNYLSFIKKIFSNKSVIILSVGLPTLDDEHYVKSILHYQVHFYEENPINALEKNSINCELHDIIKRTEITLHFNEILKEEIIKLNNSNIKYLDITSFTYDSELKRIKDEYFTRYDHHNFTRNVYIEKIIDEYLLKSI